MSSFGDESAKSKEALDGMPLKSIIWYSVGRMHL